MTVQIDHIQVPSHDMNAGAKLLAELLGVRWLPPPPPAPKPMVAYEWTSGTPSEEVWQAYDSYRASVYVNDSSTVDFVSAREPIQQNHYCLRASDSEFDAILERIKKAGINFWSSFVPGRQPDHKINTRMGGKGLYLKEPDGHLWEILTISYARPRK